MRIPVLKTLLISSCTSSCVGKEQQAFAHGGNTFYLCANPQERAPKWGGRLSLARRSSLSQLCSSSWQILHETARNQIWNDEIRNFASRLAESETSSSIDRCRFLLDGVNAPIQRLYDPFLDKHGVELYLKREDLIHKTISGNKWRKLKYNVLQACLDDVQVRLKAPCSLPSEPHLKTATAPHPPRALRVPCKKHIHPCHLSPCHPGA